MSNLQLAQEPEADAFISDNAFALLVGMVLDQQIPLEKAFAGPLELQRRLDIPLTPEGVVGISEDTFTEAFVQKPALHRFPAANAQRVYNLAHIVIDQYGGVASDIWNTAPDGDELLRRVFALPGFGERKAKIFVALLGKQMKVRPDGWQRTCAPFGDDGTTMSIADITDPASRDVVRAWKQSQKQAKKKQ